MRTAGGSGCAQLPVPLAAIPQHGRDNRFFNSISVVSCLHEFENRPDTAGSNAAPKADTRQPPGAFDRPPARFSSKEPTPRQSAPRGLPTRMSSNGLVFTNSEADALALSPEPFSTTSHRGSSRKTTARPCASRLGPGLRSSAVSGGPSSSAPARR